METELRAATAAAWAAHERGDWPDAIRHWQTCIRLDPDLGAAYWMGGALLLGEGRLDEAEAMLAEGVRRDPANVLMAVEHAKSATALGNWPEAIRRWKALVRRAPETREVVEGWDQFVMRLKSHEIDETIADRSAGIDWDSVRATPRHPDDRELFMGFESLGDDCEFGLVQRQFGADPLSLLRWNAISLPSLIAGIADGFREVGEPRLNELRPVFADELGLRNDRYGMATHTFIRESHVPAAERPTLHARLCRRQAYLGRKLIEDLREPSKIFVYKTLPAAPLSEVRRLHAAMERYAPNRLLYVVDADAERPAGSVEEIAPRLFVGAVPLLWRRINHWDTIDFTGWRDLCRNVLAVARPAAAPAPTVIAAAALPAPPIAVAAPSPAPVRPAKRASSAAWDVLTSPDQPAATAPRPQQPHGLFARVIGRFTRQ
jgi:tetratricopeptide (TPR) repeat protein